MNYRLDADFTPVIKLSVSYNVLVVNPSVPAKSVADLVAHLKASNGKLNFSSGGFGTPAHLVGELFKLQASVEATLRRGHSPGRAGKRHVAAHGYAIHARTHSEEAVKAHAEEHGKK